MTGTEDGTDCGEGVHALDPVVISVAQEGDQIVVAMPSGVLRGTVVGGQATVSGSLPEDGGWTAITYSIRMVGDNNFTGTALWTWSLDPSGVPPVCEGTTQVAGVRRPAMDAQVLVVSEHDDFFYSIHLADFAGDQAQIAGSDWAVVAGNPVWAPDGRHVALSGPDGLYVVAPDGSLPRRVVDGLTDPGAWAWSPDGSRIALARWNDLGQTSIGIYTLRPDGTGLVKVSEPFDPVIPDEATGVFAWAPNGARIAYEGHARTQKAGVGDVVVRAVYTALPIGGGTARVSVDTAGANAGLMDWVPDSTRASYFVEEPVGFADPTWGIHTASPLGGDDVRIVDPLDLTETRWAAWLSWSPDGSRLAMLTDDRPRGGLGYRLCTVGADGSNFVHLTDSADVRELEGMHWAPDGSRIGYFCRFATGGPTELRIAAAATATHVVVAGPLAEPPWGNPPTFWSVDGSHVAYGNDVPAGAPFAPRLFVVRADGTSGPVEVSGAPDQFGVVPAPLTAFAWAPSAPLIAFSDSVGRLYTSPPEGGSTRVVPGPPTDAPVAELAWTADGARIVYSSGVDVYAAALPTGPAVRAFAGPAGTSLRRFWPRPRLP